MSDMQVIETAAYNGLQFGIYELVKALWIRQRGLSPDALIGTIANLGHTIQHETHYEMVADNE